MMNLKKKSTPSSKFFIKLKISSFLIYSIHSMPTLNTKNWSDRSKDKKILSVLAEITIFQTATEIVSTDHAQGREMEEKGAELHEDREAILLTHKGKTDTIDITNLRHTG